MQWFKRLLRQPVGVPAPRRVGGFPACWSEGRAGIFGFLESFALQAGAPLPAGASQLPDDELVQARSGGQLRWGAGAMDGVLGHHAQGPEDVSTEQAVRLLEAAVATRAPEAVKGFYDFVNDGPVLRLIDPLMGAVRRLGRMNAADLRPFARWLARESPDRSPVKVGIALLGLLTPAEDTALLMRLGLHDEFTLYVAVALGNTLPDATREDALWTLARQIDGWGRIHVVERLATTTRADIRAWLLREGYRNSVMFEYLAHACAVGGGLLAALEADAVDDALLAGAGDLIGALISGGPAQDMADYDDGARVVPRFLAHVARSGAPSVQMFLAVMDVADFVDDVDRDWGRLEAQGWTAAHRASISAQAAELRDQPRWRGPVFADLESGDDGVFTQAARAAAGMGVDVWERFFERQRHAEGSTSYWWHLMQTRDPARIDRILALALEQIDLAAIATGPADEPGQGAGSRQQLDLGMILQDLGAFPARGWALVEAGLRCRSVRNRNMALKALGEWGRPAWPAAAEAELRAALAVEPQDDVRARIATLLAT